MKPVKFLDVTLADQPMVSLVVPAFPRILSCHLTRLVHHLQCCAISTSAPLLASGLIDGRLDLHTFTLLPSGLSSEAVQLVEAHASGHSCRSVAFVMGGAGIATGSSDLSLALFDSATAALVRTRLSSMNRPPKNTRPLLTVNLCIQCPLHNGLYAASGEACG